MQLAPVAAKVPGGVIQMSAMETDFYEILGVSRDADGATLKSAYRKLAMEYHPDRNGGCKENEDKFKAVSAAYECLKDPQKRAAYDRYGHAAFQNGGPGGFNGGPGADFADLGDIFETIFGNAFGGGARQRPRRGADLRYDMQIGLEEAFHGKSTQIEVEVSVACEPCHGSGAEPGTGTRSCNLCHGHGKVRAQQGFFVVERPCHNCGGRGEVLEKSMPRVPRRRPSRPAAVARGRDSARSRYRHPHPPCGEGRSRADGRPSGRPLHLRPRPPARRFRARGDDAVHAGAGQLLDCGARRRRSRFPASTAKATRSTFPPASSRASN